MAADIDRSSVNARDTSATVADLPAAASRTYAGTAASGPLYPGTADRGAKAAPSRQMAAPVIDARYLMTGSSSLSGNVEDLFIPADMPGDNPTLLNSAPEMPSNESPAQHLQ
ncbi:hypothetical protein GFM29_05060 [Rhizobium leguminosarum bv. viciae]|nr:hypothetical protein [Rhizobium leguminosarum bv. viciae]